MAAADISGDACEGGSQIVDNWFDMGATKAGASTKMAAEAAAGGNHAWTAAKAGLNLNAGADLPHCDIAGLNQSPGAMDQGLSPSHAAAQPGLHAEITSQTTMPRDMGSMKVGDIGSQSLMRGDMMKQPMMHGDLHQALSSLMDATSNMSSPMGFLGKLVEFLLSLFASAGEALANLLPNIELYEHAAEAALEATKMKMLQS